MNPEDPILTREEVWEILTATGDPKAVGIEAMVRMLTPDDFDRLLEEEVEF